MAPEVSACSGNSGIHQVPSGVDPSLGRFCGLRPRSLADQISCSLLLLEFILMVRVNTRQFLGAYFARPDTLPNTTFLTR